MPRSHAFAVAGLLLGLLAGCGEVAREPNRRASPIGVTPRVTTTISVGAKGQVSSLLPRSERQAGLARSG